MDTSSTDETVEETTSAETTPSEATTSNGVTSQSVEETSLTEAPTTTQEVTSETTSQSAGITSSANVCLAGLKDPNGQPDVDSRISDCSAYNTVTVSPFAS